MSIDISGQIMVDNDCYTFIKTGLKSALLIKHRILGMAILDWLFIIDSTAVATERLFSFLREDVMASWIAPTHFEGIFSLQTSKITKHGVLRGLWIWFEILSTGPLHRVNSFIDC